MEVENAQVPLLFWRSFKTGTKTFTDISDSRSCLTMLVSHVSTCESFDEIYPLPPSLPKNSGKNLDENLPETADPQHYGHGTLEFGTAHTALMRWKACSVFPPSLSWCFEII